MATAFGNTAGPVYPLGKIVVATAHTTVPLSQNVGLTTGFGPVTASTIKVMAPSGNTGDVYLIFTGQASNGTGGTSVVLSVPKGTERELKSYTQGGAFNVAAFSLDADNNGDSAYVTLVNA
jgi:hypothetical protein